MPDSPRHATRAPEPGRLPLTIALDDLEQPPGRTLRVRRQRPPRRPVRQFFRSRRGRWVLIALACLATVLVGLLAAGFTSSPAKRSADGLPSPTGGLGAVPGPDLSSSAAAKGGKHEAANDPVQILKNKFPDNPLNHLRGNGLHHVTISVQSRQPVAVVGYLVPTGLGSVYGTVKPNARHWSLSEQALGPGYLAAVFVQAGKSGVPVTCSVTVDGKATNSETTSGAYGRAVCLG